MRQENTRKILIVCILLFMPVFLLAFNGKNYGSGVIYQDQGGGIFFSSPVDDTIDIASEPLVKKLKIDSVQQKYPSGSVDNDSSFVAIDDDFIRGEKINFRINNGFNYRNISDFQTEKGVENYKLWRKKKERLDSLQKQLGKWRREYANAVDIQKRKEAGKKIVAAEGNLFVLQKETQTLAREARFAETQYWDTVSHEKRVAFEQQLANVAMQEKRYEEKQSEITLHVLENSKIVSPAMSSVEIQEKENTEQSEKVIYKVQLGAYSHALPSYMKKLFDKLSYIRKIENYKNERGITIYSTGNLEKYEDAVKLRNQIRQEGVKDAYIIPYYDGKSISLKEAKRLEQKK